MSSVSFRSCLILQLLLCPTSGGVARSEAESPRLEQSPWHLAGSRPMDYTADAPAGPVHSPRFVGKGAPTGFGTLMQAFDAAPYRGKRVRFSGIVRANGVSGRAGLWMRIDGAQQEMLGFDNMHSRPITGTTPPTRHDVVLDVPVEARVLALGVLIIGAGETLLTSPTSR